MSEYYEMSAEEKAQFDAEFAEWSASMGDDDATKNWLDSVPADR